jgi:hypothetical protein
MKGLILSLIVFLTAIVITITVPSGVDVIVVTEIPTATHTLTPVPTATATSTHTPTPTQTPVPTATATATPIPTLTPTPVSQAVFTIPKSVSSYNATTAGVKPGDTICLESGQRGNLILSGVYGTASKPVTVKNCGGVALFKKDGFVGKLLVLQNSRYLRITGSGSPSDFYGIEIWGGTVGFTAHTGVSDLELDHLFIHDSLKNAGFAAGIKIHSASGTPFYNLVLHNLRVKNVANECIYLGLAESDGVSPMINASLSDSSVEECGWDGVDWKQVEGVNSIQRVIIINVGDPDDTTQQKGVGLIASHNTKIIGVVIKNARGDCYKDLNPGTNLEIRDSQFGPCGGAWVYHNYNTRLDVTDNIFIAPALPNRILGGGEVSGNTVIQP